ncbi:MAG: cadA [Paenibacillaceae bacterium]|jgi:Cd2+/Zn2+-exporting ATPase|nr:cadA [Paenibacillaceae bacterium]
MTVLNKQYLLEGLCCGNCAAKIQKDVGLLAGVKSAAVDVSSKVLSVSCENDTGSLVSEISRIAASHDEDITVKEV